MTTFAQTEQIAPPATPPKEQIDAPVAAPPMQETEELFKVVEEQPTFAGCEDIEDRAERRKCAETKMLKFIYENIKYPDEAKKAKIQGTVYVQYVIEKDGRVTNGKVIRDIGGGCGEESLRMVSIMPNWNPGRQRGKPVRVQFNLPIKFKLE